MTDKLKDIREGDTVEVTFRGVVLPNRVNEALTVKMDGARLETSWWATEGEVASTHFSIKKVEKPLAVGDRVRHRRGAVGEVLSVDDGDAWVRIENLSEHTRATWQIADLERVS